MPTLTIEGREVTVPEGTSVLEAARRLGIEIPTFCHHPALSVAGNCRMCLVEVEKQPRLQASCALPAAEGMVVRVSSEKAVAARRAAIEFMLANHPLDCPICDKAGECLLQDNAMEHGLLRSRFRLAKNRKPKAVDAGPHVILDAERCIMCGRCVRFLDEVTKTRELGIFGRGNREEIGVPPGERLDNPYSGNVADLCPVGALTLKEFRFQSRVWFLAKTDSVCPSCARGCNVSIETNTSPINKTGNRRVYRLTPRFNERVNGHWMCDEGRFGFRFVDENRVPSPAVREGGTPVPVSWDEAFAALKGMLGSADPRRVAVMLSRGSTLEDLFLAREFASACLKGARVTAGAPSDRPPVGDGFLVEPDKWPNTAGARALGLDCSEEGWGKAVDAAKRGGVEVLVIVGHDLFPVLGSGEAESVLRRAGRIVVLARNVSATTARADLLLPVAAFAERDGTYVNGLGRVQRLRRAVPPLGSALPEWLVWKEMTGRFGFPWLARSEAEVFAAMAREVPALEGLTWDGIGSEGVPVRGPAGRKP